MMLLLASAAAALVVGVQGSCSCNTAVGNTWRTDRACGGLPDDSGVWYLFDDHTEENPHRKCQMRPTDERNRCPSYAPVEEELTDDLHYGFVWCDCMDEHQRIVKAATEAECMRTEGLTREQELAYQAIGVDTNSYVCECCACKSTIHGVPKVGDAPKTCDAGGTDTDDLGADCAVTTYWAFFFALCALAFAGVYVFLHKRHVEQLKNEKESKRSSDSG
jgi:hypothetical protein